MLSSEGKNEISEFVSENLKYSVHLYKNLLVTLTDDRVHQGWLKCIDPMTGTLILISLRHLDDDTYEVRDVVFIQKQYIVAVDVLLEVKPEIKSFLLKLYAPVVVAVDEDRRDRLVAFIKAHRVGAEISADGRDIVTCGIKIQPPYTADSCMGSNAIVVVQTGKIIAIFDERSKAERAKSNEESGGAEGVKSKEESGGAEGAKANEESDLKSGMENLKIAPAQAEKDFLSDFFSSDEADIDSSSYDEAGSFKKQLKRTSSGESSSTEESYEFVSKE